VETGEGSVYWNRRVKALVPYVPGEQPREGRFIKLNTNENPYPPSPKAAEAIRDALSGGGSPGSLLRLYPDPDCTELRKAIAGRYGVKPEQVFAGNGSDEVLAFAFAAFFESAGPDPAGDPGRAGKPFAGGLPGGNALPGASGALPILFPDITYSFYPVYAGLWGIPFCTIPLGEDFSIHTGDYHRPCGGVVFPNPNAPTGRAVPLEAILALAEYQGKASRPGVVILDEAYGAFAGEGTGSAVPHIGAYPNLLTVHTLSKSASLAGLRVGFAIGDEELIRGLCRVRDSFNSYTLDRLALAGAAAAVSDAPYYEGLVRRISATRERVSAALRALGIEVIPSAANFIFIRFPQKSGPEVFTALRDRGFLVRRFDKPRIADYLRVSIGTDEDMDRFLEACGNLQPTSR
jgi:histidinol-phosphate aminotransferase